MTTRKSYLRSDTQPSTKPHEVDENIAPKLIVEWTRAEIQKFKSDNKLNPSMKHKQLAPLLQHHSKFQLISINDIQSMLQLMRQNRHQQQFQFEFAKRNESPAAMYQFFKIVSKSTHIVSDMEIDRVEDLAVEIKARFLAFREQWPYVNLKKKLERREKRFKEFSLGNKFHSILGHSAEWMRLWGCTPGWVGEESVEAVNKLIDGILARYRNQRGCLAVKFAMVHLNLVTSAKYRNR